MNKTATEKRRDRIGGHLSRKQQIAATQAFAQIARREVSVLPERLRFAVAAISEIERVDAETKIRQLTDQLEALKLENLRLKAALAQKSAGSSPAAIPAPLLQAAAPALAAVQEEAAEGQMVRAVPDHDDDLTKF